MKKLDETSVMRKHINLICFLCTVIVPLINNFVLSLVLSFISGDIMLVVWAEMLSYFVVALDTINLFLVFGVLVNSLIRFGSRGSRRVISLCFVRIFIVYASYLTIGSIVTANPLMMLKSNLIYCVTNGAIDILLLAGTLFLVLFLRSKFIEEKNTNIALKKFIDIKNPLLVVTLWVTALISAFLLSGCVISTVSDIATYGANNLNATEVIYLVSPYIKWIIKTIFGYCVMWVCAKWFETQWRNMRESIENE